jgi:eukaryotic-like serine/threonine-protein kinase
MNPDALQRIFDAAVALPATDRAGFLDEVCRNDSVLRTHIERLLAASDDASILDSTNGQDGRESSSMFLPERTRLGPYEIVGRLGVGGMGEVYKATDIRLDRTVAIKILPAHLSADPESQLRFDREAKAIAALNHPHICALYDVGRDAGITFLVMEFIEGETLEQRILPGPVPMDDGIRIGVAIADALAKAHARGIVHRDIKPSNVMVTNDGLVKVLDFGLAKLQPDPFGVDVTAVATTNLSISGKIVGTVAYMSPEQAEGRPIDDRSDLFSFGVLLYEMFTGSRPFSGETPVSVISSILRDVPSPLREFNPELPPELDAFVATCLSKDPRERVHSAREIRDRLQLLTHGSRALRAASWGPAILKKRTASSRKMAASVAGLLLAALGAIYLARVSSQKSRELLTPLELAQVTSTGNASWPAVSPDGQYIAFVQINGVGGQSLWLQQTVSGNAIQLVPADPLGRPLLSGPTITPDSAFVDFAWGASLSQLNWWRVPLLGGTPKMMTHSIASAVGWSADGTHAAFVRRDSTSGVTHLIVSGASGAEERVLVTRRTGRLFRTLAGPGHNRPAWSPDGRSIALFVTDNKGVALDVVDVESGNERVIPLDLSQGASNAAWVDGSSLILSAQTQQNDISQVWRISYPDGHLTRLTNDLTDYVGVSLSRDRTKLVTMRAIMRGDLWIGDADGQHMSLAIPPTNEHGSRSVFWLGSRVAFVSAPLDISKVFVYDFNGAPEAIVPKPFSDDATASGDGNSIIMAGPGGLVRTDSRGQHAIKLVTWPSEWPVVTADSRTVLFISSSTGRKTLWSVPLTGGTPTQVTNMETMSVAVASDSRSLLIRVIDEQGGAQHMVCTLPTCNSPRKIDTSQAAWPSVRWTPDRTGIAYADRGAMNIFVQSLDGSVPRPLTHFTDGYTIEEFAWSPDGRRLALTRLTQLTDVVMLKGLSPSIK